MTEFSEEIGKHWGWRAVKLVRSAGDVAYIESGLSVQAVRLDALYPIPLPPMAAQDAAALAGMGRV